MDTEIGPLQAEVAEDSASQHDVRNLMMRGYRQDMAGYLDLRRRDAQLLQEHSQSVKALRVAQLNRPDPVLVTAEADRKLGQSLMNVRAIWTDKVKHARHVAELTH
jgi:hypothetical protein